MTLAKGGPMMLANSPDHGPMMLATDNWLMPIKLPPSLQRGRHTLEDDVAWAVCASLAWHSPRDLGSASSSFCQSCPTESDYGTGFCLIVIGRGGGARRQSPQCQGSGCNRPAEDNDRRPSFASLETAPGVVVDQRGHSTGTCGRSVVVAGLKPSLVRRSPSAIDGSGLLAFFPAAPSAPQAGC